MDQHASDERVMLQLAAGVDSGLAELMRRWEGPIWCFIDRMCGRLHCTDDIYQEVWTRVYLYRRRFKPLHPFGPYLFRIAANCCRDAQAARLTIRPQASNAVHTLTLTGLTEPGTHRLRLTAR